MATFSNQHFSNQVVHIDGNQYFGCTFTNCQMVYSGGELPVMDSNTFDGGNWGLDGSAVRTITYLRNLYFGGMRPLVENLFKQITTPGPDIPSTH